MPSTWDEIQEMPGYLIRRCNQVAIALFLEETKEHDLTTAQYTALALIAEEPGMDQTRLMERSGLDRSSVTKCVERMETRGVISRKTDPADRRVRRLYPTPAGHALLKAVAAGARRSQMRILAPLGAKRARLFIQMLSEVAEANNSASRVPLRGHR
jgi:DNA-binding MarR family transcriptional regulator